MTGSAVNWGGGLGALLRSLAGEQPDRQPGGAAGTAPGLRGGGAGRQGVGEDGACGTSSAAAPEERLAAPSGRPARLRSE